MCGVDSDVMLGFTAGRHPLATHICLLFDSSVERDSVFLPYLAAGLSDRHRVELFADVDTASQKYCPHGTFRKDDMLARLRGVHKQAKQGGWAGGRV